MKWMKNIENLSNSENLGYCPFCNSDRVRFRYVDIDNEMGFGDIWCDDCKHAYHISRMKKIINYGNAEKLPNNLIY